MAGILSNIADRVFGRSGEESAPACTLALPDGLTPEKWVAQAKAQWPANYGSAQDRALHYYKGHTSAETRQALAEAFPRTHARMMTICLQIVRNIIKLQARVYVEGQALDLVDAKGNVVAEAGGAKWSEVLERTLLESKLGEVNRRAHLCKLYYARTTWDDERKAPCVTLFPPHRVFPLFDSDSRSLRKARGVLLEAEPEVVDGKPCKRFEFWSAGKTAEESLNFIVSEDGKRIATGESGGLNPYRDDSGRPVLPIVAFLGDDADDGYWQMPSEQLIDGQKAIDTGWANILHILKLQGFGVPVSESQAGAVDVEPWTGAPARRGARGDAAQASDGASVTLSPDSILTVPKGRTFEFKSPQSPIGELVATIIALAKQIAVLESIPPAAILAVDGATRAASGYQVQLEQGPLVELRQEQIPLYRQPTHDLIDLVRIVWNTHQDGNTTRFLGVRPRWTPGKMQPPLDPEARNREIIQRLDKQLVSRVDALCEIYGIDETEAEDYLREIDQQARAKQAGSFADVAASLRAVPGGAQQPQLGAKPALSVVPSPDDKAAPDTKAQPAAPAPAAKADDAIKFFQYEIEGGLVTIDEVRKAKGLPPIKDGDLTLPQYRAKYQETYAQSTVAQASGTAAQIVGLDTGDAPKG